MEVFLIKNFRHAEFSVCKRCYENENVWYVVSQKAEYFHLKFKHSRVWFTFYPNFNLKHLMAETNEKTICILCAELKHAGMNNST